MPRKKDVMGQYMPSEKDREAYAWCMNNSIVVGFSPIWASEDDWTIDIKINNKSSVDPNTYTGEEVMAKVYEYYKYYYDKYEK